MRVEWFSDMHTTNDSLAEHDCDKVHAPTTAMQEPYRDLLFAVLATGVQGAAKGNAEDTEWVLGRTGGLRFKDLCALFDLDPDAVLDALARDKVESGRLRNLFVASTVRKIEPLQRGMEKSVDLRGTRDGKISAWNRKFAEA